jgi:hypothetical protein
LAVSLAGGSPFESVSNVSFDSDPAGTRTMASTKGETATFPFTSFASQLLAAGVHERSLINDGAADQHHATIAVPERETSALLALGLGVLAWASRRRMA